MVFSSLTFILFFLPVVLAAYFLVRRELRNVVLLCASLLFYAWGEPVYVVLMVLSIAVNYGLTIAMGKIMSSGKNKNLGGGLPGFFFLR